MDTLSHEKDISRGKFSREEGGQNNPTFMGFLKFAFVAFPVGPRYRNQFNIKFTTKGKSSTYRYLKIGVLKNYFFGERGILIV